MKILKLNTIKWEKRLYYYEWCDRYRGLSSALFMDIHNNRWEQSQMPRNNKKKPKRRSNLEPPIYRIEIYRKTYCFAIYSHISTYVLYMYNKNMKLIKIMLSTLFIRILKFLNPSSSSLFVFPYLFWNILNNMKDCF